MASFAVHLMQKPGPAASVERRKFEDLPAVMLGPVPRICNLTIYDT